MLAGAVLRGLANTDLWRDEASTYFEALDPSRVPQCELNPPLFFLLSGGWLRLWGDSPLAMKSLAWLCGVLLIPASYALARTRASSETSPPVFSEGEGPALAAALLVACSPQAIYYSGEARPYSMAALLACLGLVAFLRERPGLFGLLSTALVYLQYTGLLWMGALLVVFRRLWPLLPLLLFLPWLPHFWLHLQAGTPWSESWPWWQRPYLMLRELAFVLPLAPLLLFTLPWREPLDRQLLAVGLLGLGGIAALSLDPKYCLCFQAPLLCVLAPQVCQRRAWMAVLCLWGLSAFSGLPKSGVGRALETVREGDLVVVAPDYLGPTAGYFLRGRSLRLRGFARWEDPQLFRPLDYLEVWSQPGLVEDRLARLQAEKFQTLYLVHSPLPHADWGKMPYHQVQPFVEAVRSRYPLLRTFTVPAREEPVEVEVFQRPAGGPGSGL